MSLVSGNNLFSILCVGLFLLVFVVLIVITLVQSGKRKKALLENAHQLGFTPQSKPDPELLTRLNKLYFPAKVEKLSNLARKIFGDETYYLFDCQTSNSNQTSDTNGNSSLEYANFAILSPHLDLPPFMLITRLPSMPGALEGMLENLIVMAAARAGLQEYQAVSPEFSLKYMLFTRDDPRCEKVFTNEVLAWIAHQEQLVVRGEDDLLIYNRYEFRRIGNVAANKLADLVQEARQLCDWLVK